MEFAFLVWFIEVFSATYFVLGTGEYIGFSLTAFLFFSFIAAVCHSSSNEIFDKWWEFCIKKAFKPWCWGLLFFLVTNAIGDLLPNKDAAYKIAAAYGVQQAYMAASESEDVKRMAGKSLLVLETSMDRYLSDGLAKAAGITVNTETVSGAVSSVKDATSEVLTKEDVQKVKDAAVTKLVGTLTGPQQ